MQLSKREIVALYARRDFTAFKFLAWRRYEYAKHLTLVDNALMQVAKYIETGGKDGIQNLMIEMPPRSGKSMTVARLFPAWLLGRNPNMRVIEASYGESLTVKHSRFVRNIVGQPYYQDVFPGVRLAEDSRAKNAWDFEKPYEGGMDAVGKGGALTGKGANLIITDDLVKSRAEAESALQRDKDWDWLQDDLLTRKEKGAAHVAIGTRWHTDDPHGRLKLNEPDLWHVIKLPAIAEQNDLMGRKPGEALWPERFSISDLELTKRRMGEYSFSSLYQQEPQSREGGLFKRINFTIINEPPPESSIIRTVRFWDLALSERTSADYTVGVKMALTKDATWIVLDIARFQIEWDELPNKIRAIILRDGKGVEVGIEKTFYQSRAVQKLQQHTDLYGYSIRGFAPDADKFTRALPYAARVGERMVYVLRRGWTEEYIEELTSFPLGSHDDQVDASSGAYLMFDRKPITVEVTRWA